MSISVNNITKLYGEQKALNNVSFEVSSGQIVGFLGPNGAGKSTMMKIITCYLPQNSGIIKVSGFDVNEDSLEVRKNVGYLPENNPLYLDMYVKEYLGFICGIYKFKDVEKRVSKFIELTGLGIEQNKKIGALSKGYRQRVGLAQALIHDPKVLILDEPTTGLDPNQIIEIRNLIKEVGKEKTVMLSTHIMQEAKAICDRIIIINQGEIVADNSAEELQKNNSNNQTIKIEFDHKADLQLLKGIKGVLQIKEIKEKNYLISTDANKDVRPELFKFAVAHKLTVLSLSQEEQSLEDVFRKLTKKN